MVSKNMLVSIAGLVLLCVLDQAQGTIEGTQNNVLTENIVEKEAEKDPVPVAIEGNRTGRSLLKECGSGIFQSAKCLKIHALSYLEDLSSRDELNILPGLSIVKENLTENVSKPEELAAELSRQFPGKPDEKLNRYLLLRVQEYLNRHSLRYRLLDPDTTKEAIDMAKGETGVVSEGRRRGQNRIGGGGLMAAAVMMKGALAASAMGALALLAGKALMTALMSLLLSALVGLKDKGGHKTTYEIIAKPEISHHHSHSSEEHHEHEHGHHGGYRRAYDTNYNYNNYMPYENSYTSPSSPNVK